MYEEEIHFGKLLLKQQFWNIWRWWPRPLTQWPQFQYESSAAQAGSVDQVWGR